MAKFNAIGDVLNITPVLRFLKLVEPGCEIDFLVGRWAEPAIQNNRQVKDVIVIENEWLARPGPFGIFKLIVLFFALRKRHYDAILGFHKSKYATAFLTLLGAKHYIYFSSLPKDQPNKSYLDEKKHFIVNNLALAEKLILKMGAQKKEVEQSRSRLDYRMDWTVSKDEQDRADRIVADLMLERGTRLVGLVPGGGRNPHRNEGNIRQWGRSKFEELIENVRRLPNTKIVLFGSIEDSTLGECLLHGNEAGVLNFVGKHSIRISAAIMSKCALMVTNDTGPMHIAAALGVPTVAVFGPTGAKEKLPPGNFFFGIQSSLHCSPCYYAVFKGCIYDHIRCLAEIPVSQVFDVVKKILSISIQSPEFTLPHENIIIV